MLKLSYPDKESAVVGYIGTRGFEGVPTSSVLEPEAFDSPIFGVLYAAAHQLHRAGRPVNMMQILDAVERMPHWLRLVDGAAKDAGMADWRDAAVTVDNSLAYNTQGGAIVCELLHDISEAHIVRRSTEIGTSLAKAEVDPRKALAELAKLTTPRTSMAGVEVHSFNALWKYEPEKDDSSLLGDRWVCKGGQLLVVGQSGIGKSSLTVQAAITWALGLPFFGIKPARALRSLFIQAENDMGDMSDIVKGVMASAVAQSRMPHDKAVKMITSNLTFVRVTAQTGQEFIEVVRHLLEAHGPVDLVFGDPLLSYIGDDISQQAVASHFLRGLCNPIAFEHGFAWVWSHHTGKPQSDSKSRAHWNSNDYAYVGLGSSELTNWARAICVLQTTKYDGIFKLLLAKRGNRAAVLDEHGHPSTDIIIKHAAKGLHWESATLPEDAEEDVKPQGKAGRTPKISLLDEAEIIAKHAAWPTGARGFYGEMSAKYKVSRDTIERILKRSKQSTQEQKAA